MTISTLDGTVNGDGGTLIKIDGGIRGDLLIRTNQLRVWIFEDERVRRKKEKLCPLIQLLNQLHDLFLCIIKKECTHNMEIMRKHRTVPHQGGW